MTDELEITSGGMISIDSHDVRSIGDRLGNVRARLQGVREQLWRAHAMVLHLTSFVSAGGIAECARRVDALAGDAGHGASGVWVMADTFEYAELRAKQEALATVRPDEAAALQVRIDELYAKDPLVEDRSIMMRAAWNDEWIAGTGEQTWDSYARLLGPFLRNALGVGGVSIESLLQIAAVLPGRIGTGRPAADSHLQGEAPPVEVQQISHSQVTPVTGVQDSLERLPNGSEGQVVVEKYTFEDGSEKFVAYIDGTRSPAWFTDEPWDMGSNTDMYLQQKTAASYVATMKALEAAGVGPDDDLSLVTYSQGGLIGTYIATGSDYKVGTWIAAGNPTDPALDADQVYVDIRHRGDVVSNLAGGGDPGGTGSSKSFTVRASVDPGSPIEQHGLTHYIDTGGQIDQSGDPREEALREEHFAVLGQAVQVERMEFQARRP